MNRRQPVQFTISTALAATTLIALLLAPIAGNLFLILVMQLVTILVAVELLSRNLPQGLMKASEDNCFRLDGGRSRRRSAQERKALRKVRKDLFAVFLIVAITGNVLVLAVHTQILPLPIVGKAFSVFSLDTKEWQDNLQATRVDDMYEAWSRSKRGSTQDAVESQKLLWMGWPIVALGAAAWVLGCMYWLSFAFSKTLQEFESGITARSQKNLHLDVGRMQHQAETQ